MPLSTTSEDYRPLHPFFSNPLKTRADVEAALISLLDPLGPATSPGGALVKIGHTATHYDDIAAQIEGFARPLWGLAALLAGGGAYSGTERYLKGFSNGTNPSSSEFWGWTRGKDQRMVEMSPMGFLLATTKEAFWDKLASDEDRANIAQWMGAINDKEMPDTNWLWFRVFANLGLQKVGQPFSQTQLKADLDHLDTFYLGDGWSRDGPEGVRQLDYYSGSFAIQVAQLIYSKLADKEDPVRCAEYRDRARKYALDFAYYFDTQGRAIPFGRSMTYRCAMAAFWGALAFADVLPPAPLNDWGVIKGLLLRNVRYWTTQHAILDSAGLLTIGYTYPSTYATENYNSPGSPYWAFKAFIPLALPQNHPFWTSEEKPLPFNALSPSPSVGLTAPLDHPGHIISHVSPFHTFLLSSGQACHYPLRHGAEKYGKLAYSSAFGYAMPTGSYLLDQHCPDSTIALSDCDDGQVEGERWVVRREVEWAHLERAKDGSGVSWLRALWKPWKDTEVETWLVPPHPDTPDWHLRVHRIKSGRKKVLISDAGFSIHGQRSDGRILDNYDENNLSALLSHAAPATADDFSMEGKIAGNGSVVVRSSVGISAVKDLTPSSLQLDPRVGEAVILDANSNIIFPRSAMPTLRSTYTQTQGEIWLVTGVFALELPAGLEGGALAARWSKVPQVPAELAKLLLSQ